MDAEHRLKFFANYYPRFNRIGTENNASGFFLNVGVIRNSDIFGQGGDYAGRSNSDVDDAKGWAVEFASPAVTWVSNRPDTLRTSNLDFSLNVFNITKDFSLTSAIRLFTGVGATYNFGTQYAFTSDVTNIETFGQTFKAGDRIKISGGSVVVPVGIRLMLGSKFSIKKPWVKIGVKNHFNVYNRIFQDVGEYFSIIGNASDYLKPHTISMMFGAGIDVPVGDKSIVRVGISYDKSRSNITTNIFDTRLETLSLAFGLVF